MPVKLSRCQEFNRKVARGRQRIFLVKMVFSSIPFPKLVSFVQLKFPRVTDVEHLKVNPMLNSEDPQDSYLS